MELNTTDTSDTLKYAIDTTDTAETLKYTVDISDSYPLLSTSLYQNTNLNNSIIFYNKTVNNPELLRISSDGFYVRGVKVKANRIEGKKVYKAFKKFLKMQGLL